MTWYMARIGTLPNYFFRKVGNNSRGVGVWVRVIGFFTFAVFVARKKNPIDDSSVSSKATLTFRDEIL